MLGDYGKSAVFGCLALLLTINTTFYRSGKPLIALSWLGRITLFVDQEVVLPIAATTMYSQTTSCKKYCIDQKAIRVSIYEMVTIGDRR